MIDNEIKNKFEEIYTKEIEPKLDSYEKDRLKVFPKYHFFTIVGIICTLSLFFLFAFLPQSGGINILLICVLFFMPVFLFGQANKINQEFKRKIKSSLLKSILNIFGKFNIYKNELITLNGIKELGLYPQAFSKIDDDNIIGEYNNKNICFIETDLSHTERRGKHSYTVTDFKGLIIKTDLDKELQGICVLYDRYDLYAEPMIGSVRANYVDYNEKKEVLNKLERVVLEDVEFNHKYNIYSNDQVEARYILTPAFMEKIKGIQEQFGAKSASVVFRGREIYLFLGGIYTNMNKSKDYKGISSGGFFEVGNVSQTLKNKRIYEKTFGELMEIFSLVDFLNSPNKAS